MNKNVPEIDTEISQINILRERTDKPITIFIGGVFGAGKTSLSYNLSVALGIKQRSSLGMITKTLMYVNRKDPALRSLNAVERSEKDFTLFFTQCKEICSVVNFITKVSKGDGTDIILDGVQLNPNNLVFDSHTVFLFLKSGGPAVLKKQLNQSTTHRIRYKNIDENQVMSLLELESQLLSRITQTENIRFLDHVEGEEEQVLSVLKALKEWLISTVRLSQL